MRSSLTHTCDSIEYDVTIAFDNALVRFVAMLKSSSTGRSLFEQRIKRLVSCFVHTQSCSCGFSTKEKANPSLVQFQFKLKINCATIERLKRESQAIR